MKLGRGACDTEKSKDPVVVEVTHTLVTHFAVDGIGGHSEATTLTPIPVYSGRGIMRGEHFTRIVEDD